MKHTPGPWTSELDEDAELGHFDIRDSDGNRVAEATNDYADYDHALAYWQSEDCPMEANAHLIAAAPDLLEALEAIHNDQLDQMKRHGDTLDTSNAMYQKVTAAIKKAKGQS